MKYYKIAFAIMFLATLVSCNSKEVFFARAMVNGVSTVYDVGCYAIKNVKVNDTGAVIYQNYIINCLDKHGGPYLWAVDSTGCCEHFSFDDFVICDYTLNNKKCSVIDAELKLTGEDSNILCGMFKMTALYGETDTIHITDGEFMISLYVNEGRY